MFTACYFSDLDLDSCSYDCHLKLFMLHELDAPVIVINTHKTNRFSFSCLGYLENLHVKGDKVILVHCPEYKSLINSRK